MIHLDISNECLLNDEHKITLTPKLFTILCYLVQHPGRLVTKQELLDNIWPNTCVTEGLIKGYVRDLRRILGDRPRTPRYIETVHGRGYRFIGPITIGVARQGSPPPRIRIP